MGSCPQVCCSAYVFLKCVHSSLQGFTTTRNRRLSALRWKSLTIQFWMFWPPKANCWWVHKGPPQAATIVYRPFCQHLHMMPCISNSAAFSAWNTSLLNTFKTLWFFYHWGKCIFQPNKVWFVILHKAFFSAKILVLEITACRRLFVSPCCCL